MKYNKKQIKAIRESIKMWEWLKDNPLERKDDYFYETHDGNGDVFPDLLNDCYCCVTFTKRKGIDGVTSCTICPLIPESQDFDDKYCLPEFYKWHDAKTKKTSKKYATIIWKKLVESLEERK